VITHPGPVVVLLHPEDEDAPDETFSVRVVEPPSGAVFPGDRVLSADRYEYARRFALAGMPARARLCLAGLEITVEDMRELYARERGR
jgi:hypothetical protein